jgi:hypothetical protein
VLPPSCRILSIQEHKNFHLFINRLEQSVLPNHTSHPNRISLKILNMKFTFATLLPFMAVLAAASPLEARQWSQVTVALSNDQSGAYSGVAFLADDTEKSILSLFGSTSVGAGGTVKANAAQLTAFPQSINCVIKNNGAIIGTLTAQHTYADLDGNPNAAVPINLNNAKIRCHA